VPSHPRIFSTAYKHGINQPDILHAYRNFIEVRSHAKDGLVYIGPARNGILLELGIVKIEQEWIIVHAMRLRKGFVRHHA
jgi:hypothetical protein